MKKRSKKRIYRAIPVKSVDVQDLISQLDERVILGCDAAKEKWYGAFMTTSGEVVLTVRWDLVHDYSELFSMLGEIVRAGVLVEIGMEPTGTYADALAYRLLEAGFQVFSVNPKHSHDYGEIFDGVPSSHDGKSAAVVAKLHLERRARSRPWPQPTVEQRRFRTAVTELDWLQEEQLRQLNWLESRLARHWPELWKILDFATASAVALIAQFGGPAEVACNAEEAQQLMRAVSKNWLSEDKIRAVVVAARDTIGVPMCDEEIELMRQLGRRLEHIRGEVKRAESRVKKLAKGLQAVNQVGQVVGFVTAAVFYGLLGDFREYPNVRALLRAFGMNLKIRSSGKHKGKLKITKRGQSSARRWLYLAVLRWVQSDATAKAWYDTKLKRNGGVKMKGLIALMRKLVAGLFHVSRGHAFDSALLFDLRRQGEQLRRDMPHAA